eukprot:116659-Amphidinium_carterae.1
MAKDCHKTWHCSAMAKLLFKLVFPLKIKLCSKLAVFISAFPPSVLKFLQQAPLPLFCCCATNALARPGKRMEADNNPNS